MQNVVVSILYTFTNSQQLQKAHADYKFKERCTKGCQGAVDGCRLTQIPTPGPKLCQTEMPSYCAFNGHRIIARQCSGRFASFVLLLTCNTADAEYIYLERHCTKFYKSFTQPHTRAHDRYFVLKAKAVNKKEKQKDNHFKATKNFCKLSMMR